MSVMYECKVVPWNTKHSSSFRETGVARNRPDLHGAGEMSNLRVVGWEKLIRCVSIIIEWLSRLEFMVSSVAGDTQWANSSGFGLSPSRGSHRSSVCRAISDTAALKSFARLKRASASSWSMTTTRYSSRCVCSTWWMCCANRCSIPGRDLYGTTIHKRPRGRHQTPGFGFGVILISAFPKFDRFPFRFIVPCGRQ